MRNFRSLFIVAITSMLVTVAAAADTVKARAKLPSGPSMVEADAGLSAQAVGHYERSRALLLSAVREFDKGYAKANPNMVLDSMAWREDIINRIKELDKVLAPQARLTNGGVKFESERELLAGEAGNKR